MSADDHTAGGALPDPEFRTWRHPAEVAMEARRLQEARRRRRLALAVGTVAAAVPLGLAGWLLAVGPSGGELVADGSDLPPALVATDVETVPVSSTPDGADRSEDDSSDGRSADRRADATTTTLLASTTIASTVAPTQPPAPDGVVRLVDAAGAPVAYGVMVDGMILTCASAVWQVDGLRIEIDGAEPRTVTTVERDPYTDLAVAVPETTDDLSPWAGAVDSLDTGLRVTSLPTGQSGVVVERADRSWSADGHPLLSTVRTTVTADGVPGQLLVDAQGNAVALSVRGEGYGGGYLLEAVPLDVALPLAHQLRTGVGPIEERLGFSVDHDGDGVVVTEVDATGPAADAGLQPGDRVLAVAEVEVDDRVDLVASLRAADGVETVAVVVEREGQALEMAVAVPAAPDEP